MPEPMTSQSPAQEDAHAMIVEALEHFLASEHPLKRAGAAWAPKNSLGSQNYS
jgi:hypothetical protein